MEPVVLREIFDMSLARRIIKVKQLPPQEHRDLTNYVDTGRKNAMREGQGQHAFVEVKYRVSPKLKLGRYIASASSAPTQLCSMWREVRAWLAYRFYHDIDICNAAPTMIYQLFEKAGLRSDELKRYVEMRKEVLEEIMHNCNVSRERAKNLIIRLTYGGTVGAWCKEHGREESDVPEAVIKLQKELHDNAKALMSLPEFQPYVAAQRANKTDKRNPLATQFAYLSQDCERQCLDSLMRAVKRSGYEVGATIYDGLLVQRKEALPEADDLAEVAMNKDGFERIPEPILREWEQSIKEDVGFTLKLEEKPMELKLEYVDDNIGRMTHDEKEGMSELECKLRSQGILTEEYEQKGRCAFRVITPGEDELDMNDLAITIVQSVPQQKLQRDMVRVKETGVFQRIQGGEKSISLDHTDMTMYMLLSSPEGERNAMVGLNPHTLMITVEDEEVGSLKVQVSQGINICHVHDCIATTLKWFVYSHSPSLAIFEGHAHSSERERGKEDDVTLPEAAPLMKVELSNHHEPKCMAARVVGTSMNGTESKMISNKGKVNILKMALQDAIRIARDRYNITPVINLYLDQSRNNTYNYGTLIQRGNDTVGEGTKKNDTEIVMEWKKFMSNYKIAKESTIINNCGDTFYYCENGLWVARSAKFAANHMVDLMMNLEDGAFWRDYISEEERGYIGSTRGKSALLTSMLNSIADPKFESRLDSKMTLLPFDNGVFDLDTEEFRPLSWADYVSQTIGYDFPNRSDVSHDKFQFIESFYEKVLPVKEEREVFLRGAGAALSGDRSNDKFFFVLTDKRAGNNGKSTLMAALKDILGSYAASSQSNFLYTSNESANAHGANDLSYKGKRLALFDETAPEKQMSMEKIKRITGGGLTMAIRGANEKVPTEFKWTAILMIGCNESNMPRVKSSDTAFLRRMVVIPFRAKFQSSKSKVDADEEQNEDVLPHTYEEDGTIKKKLHDCQDAHLHILLDAYKRYKRDNGLGELPEGCTEWSQSVISQSDPRLEAFFEFIDKRVRFDPPVQGSEKVAGVVKRDDLIRAIKMKHRNDGIFRGVTSREMKVLADTAMSSRGRKFSAHVCCRGKRDVNAYKHCELIYEDDELFADDG